MKIWLAVALMALLASPAYAVQTQRTLIDDVTLNRTSPSTQGDANISDASKVAFFVTYDSSNGETEGVTATITVAVSIDGIHWRDISWLDVAGGATPQTSEVLSKDQTYIGWFDDDLSAPYIKVWVNMTEAHHEYIYGPNDTADITVTLIEKK